MRSLTQPFLDEVVRRLTEEFDPDRIFLFGSHAWGTPDEDSDVDLLVVVPSSDERPVQRAMRGYRALRGLGVPFDVLVKTREEAARFATVPASLDAYIFERGRLLYGRAESGVGPGLAHQGVS